MNGFERMRDYCNNIERCPEKGECPFERECNLIEGFPFDLTAEEIEQLKKLAQDDEPAFGRWIPASEKEPKEYQCVLVQLSTEPLPTHDLAIYHKEYGYRPWYSEFSRRHTRMGRWEDGKVVAWMPLPAPYKEVADEHD